MDHSAPHEQLSELRVRYAETDQMGVVYHANYLVWCEIGRTDFIRTVGRSYADIERDGVTLAVSDVSMRFIGSAAYDDRIVVRTVLEEVRSRTMRFGYHILHADSGRTLVRATTTLVALNAAGRPARLPEPLLDALRHVRQPADGASPRTAAADAERD